MNDALSPYRDDLQMVAIKNLQERMVKTERELALMTAPKPVGRFHKLGVGAATGGFTTAMGICWAQKLTMGPSVVIGLGAVVFLYCIIWLIAEAQ